MATTRPCIVGTMGSTRFYETTMTARELSHTVRVARDTDAWASASIDERMQRDINMSRVRSTIVPYLANHPDRFFGSFIVLVPKGHLEFESLSEMNVSVPRAYRDSVESIGFVTLDGRGELIALDGQHRLAAFREVVTGGNQAGPMAPKVGDDEVCVLLIEEEDPVKTRRIFNKVNRNAKPTGRSDNIITSEDDGFAIVARRLLDEDAEGPLAARQVKDRRWEPVDWMATTLGKSNDKLTTISAVYDSVKAVLTAAGYREFDERDNPVAPPQPLLDEAFEKAADWWRQVLALPTFVEAMEEPTSIPGIRHSPTDRRALLFRPVGQIALARGLVRAQQQSAGSLSLARLVARAERVDWSPSPSSIWRDILIKPDGRINARKESYDVAADLITHLLAAEFTDAEYQKRVWREWNRMRGKDTNKDVDQLADEEIPEDLPQSVS